MNENFNYNIPIPVPMGAPVYRATTVCGDFCLFQKNRFTELKEQNTDGFFNGCDALNPCHTIFHSVKRMTLEFSTLELVLKEWGTRIFETPEEAEAAGRTIEEKNKKTMEELGFKMDINGYSIIGKGD